MASITPRFDHASMTEYVARFGAAEMTAREMEAFTGYWLQGLPMLTLAGALGMSEAGAKALVSTLRIKARGAGFIPTRCHACGHVLPPRAA